MPRSEYRFEKAREAKGCVQAATPGPHLPKIHGMEWQSQPALHRQTARTILANANGFSHE
jgi:hypothetical protein